MLKAIFPLLLLVLLGCSSDAVPTPPAGDIVGAWEWQRTTGGLTGREETTPASTGARVTLELYADEQYAGFRDGQRVQEGTYALTRRESIYTQTEEPYITFTPTGEGGNEPLYGVFSGIIAVDSTDQLTLSDNNYDGFGSRFTRR